jgi:hypothetical protein
MIHLFVLLTTLCITLANAGRQHIDQQIKQADHLTVNESTYQSANQPIDAPRAYWRMVTYAAPWSPRAGGSLIWNATSQSFLLFGVGIYDQDDEAAGGQLQNQPINQ